MRLNRVGQCLEQIPVLPWPDIEAGRHRPVFSRDATAKMPFDTATGTDAEHDGPQAVAVMDQDAMLHKGRGTVALNGWTNQITRRSVRDRQVGGQSSLGQLHRPESVVGGLPEGFALQELHPRNARFSAAPGL